MYYVYMGGSNRWKSKKYMFFKNGIWYQNLDLDERDEK